MANCLSEPRNNLLQVKKLTAVEEGERTVITSCTIDCGGKCPLNVHVKNGIITRIDTCDDGKIPPLKACVRGLNYLYRVYAPDRLKYPLIRVGERGGGRFRRTSWDEALTTIAAEMKRIKAAYGPEAILECTCSGSHFCLLHSTQWGGLYKMLNRFGGRTAFGTQTSAEGGFQASGWTYGTGGIDSSSYADLVNSKLIITWAWNPAENHMGTGTLYWLKRARDRGIKFISIDPCHTDTAQYLKAEWIPIRPSTDTAMLIAMAYVLITENIYDRDFVAKFTFGFGEYREYVLGVTDATPKTPEWAAKITGVPASTIVRLAREYASAKPAALILGVAPGRTANGEQYHRAGAALEAITGNVGISGGSGHCLGGTRCRTGFENSHSAYLEREGSRLIYGGKGVEIRKGNWAEAVLKGKASGYPSDIKMIYVVGHNILTSRANVKKGVEAFQKMEFVVCQEQFLTPTARYSDIVLPANTNLERNDIAIPWTRGDYAIFANKVIDSLWDSRSDLDIFRELAKRLGMEDFDARTDEEWLQYFFERSEAKKYLTYEQFKEQGVFRTEDKPFIAFKEQREDPEHHPFPTPSGKIEIYAQKLDQIDFDVQEYSSVIPGYRHIPRIPTFVQCEELPTAPRAKKYPLQLTTPHHTHRAHSQLFNIPRLRDMYRHEVWINPADAAVRGVADGDQVHMFNDRGTIQIIARVTGRMMPGVVRCYEGGWYDPDGSGVDRGGCVNVLIDDMLTSPGGATNSNTCLVEIKKVEKGRV